MQEFEPQFGHLVSIWWLRTWRGALAGAIAVTPFAIGFWLLERAGIQSIALKIAEEIVILIAGGAVAFGVSRMSLSKRYAGFRIALLPIEGGPELALTNARVLRFWWFLVWRVTLGAGVITLAGELIGRRLPPDTSTIREAIVIIAVLGWEFFVLRQALTRRYRDFRIALISEAAERRQW